MKGPRIAILAAAALGCAGLLPIVAASRAPAGADPEPREIRIVARDMAFYVQGADGDGANPTLRVKAGERVRLVLRNEDAGLTHDFVIDAWKVRTKALRKKGAEADVVFRVPNQRGTTPYQCTPHAQMMRGDIQVE